MKEVRNLYDESVVNHLLDRINKLTPESGRQWGKMNVGQMLAHCSAALKVATGQAFPPRIMIGRIIGSFFKPDFMNEKPFAKNTPTDKTFIFKDDRNFEKEKEQLIDLIKQFRTGGQEKCTKHPHSFFGKLTPEEWSTGMFKHLDHHLRQFNA